MSVPNCLILSSGIWRWCDSYGVDKGVDWGPMRVMVMGYVGSVTVTVWTRVGLGTTGCYGYRICR
jgi:hypothetical protein